ncbi:hypothetical protein [Arthrobacter sp. A2-55]|uniref:hypothetical protein n=1 Tax=Arthrobacter sp. A2-55 TaxID=2897337 RepID=UPI0021CD1E38|nr:hypothetical protein [Arthrobacter sp. A2-55]MCU6478994.1 hypothetical protein [Arthrobacter sp. A2-55]
MLADQKDQGRRGVLPILGLILLPVLCCGLPLLIAAGALGILGSMLGNPWVIAGAGALAAGLLVFAVRRQRAGRRDVADDCCTPDDPLPGGKPSRGRSGT